MYDHISRVAIQHPENNHFSLYNRPITNVDNPKSISLVDAHELITSGAYEKNTLKVRALHAAGKAGIRNKPYSKFKANNFDYATFNGVFVNREDAGFLHPSNYFIIDIDHLGYAKLLLLLERLKNDTIITPQLIFVSPSGDGLKIIVRIDFSLIDLTLPSLIMGIYWEAINAYFGTHYVDLITPNAKNEFIDGACKDLSRACFLCHDANAYLNINHNILVQSFIDEYPPIKAEPTKKRTSPCNTKKALSINPSTTIDILAARHLMAKDNHTGELLAFITACMAIGKSKAQVIKYINDFVHIAAESSKNDAAELNILVDDLYKRYSTMDEGVQPLTINTFGYNILYFKYSNDHSDYILSSLFMDGVLNILFHAGFAKRKIGKSYIYIRQVGCIINEVTPQDMRDYLTNIITANQDDKCFSYQNKNYQIPPAAIREVFYRNSNNICNATWLEHLRINDEILLKDTKKEIFVLFQNVIATISKEQIKVESWEDKTGFVVWEDQIIKRDFNYIEDNAEAHIYQFLKNVTNQDNERLITMCTGIGYLMHHYFSPSEGQAVVLYDESVTDTKNPMGGTGKGLIVNSIGQVRNVIKIDGKHYDDKSRFRLERVTPDTQAVWLDDVKPDFDFSSFNSNLTDGWTIERKYLPQFFIHPKDSPKTVICSNSVINGGGTTNVRRQFIIEISDYYSSQIKNGTEKPIEETHGGIFFNDEFWSADEWNKFYSVMLDCAYQYFNYGLVPHKGINVELNRLRQATNEDFATWVMQQNFASCKRFETKVYYTDFVTIYYGEKHQISQRTFTGFLKDYAHFEGWNFKIIQSGGQSFFQF